MNRWVAILRAVSASLAKCELTHVQRQAIDLDKARSQHAAYEGVLQGLGVRINRVPEAPDMPDAVFVEDTAVVIDEVAIITRPGAASRRGETQAVAPVLAEYRELAWIKEPGTIDGGDVLRLGKRFYVGISGRTNREGVAQFEAIVTKFGYAVQLVMVAGCLHLKSAVTQVAEGLLLVNPAWVDGRLFKSMERLEVDSREPYGANALLVRDTIIYPEQFPFTRDRLDASRLIVAPVDCSELAKAEGAVTCCSILLRE